jgi:hypothetical protein
MATGQISRNTRQTFTEQYMTGEDLINRPDIWYKVFPYLREEINMVDFMIQTGRRERTIQSTFNWHEEDILIPIAEIGVVGGTPGAGNPVTITIKQISADNEIPFKKWDTLIVGGLRGWIEKEADITIDGSGGLHQYVITPIKSTDDIVTAAVVDDFVVWYGSAKADGQNQPDSMISKPLPFNGKTQIVATNYTTHGSAAANEAYIQTRTGKWFFYYRGVEQAIVRHKMAIALTILLGEQDDGALSDTTHPDGAQLVRTTQGMELRMKAFGNPKSAAQWDFAQFEAVNNTLDENFAPDQFAIFTGHLFKNAWDNVAFDRNYYEASPNYALFNNAVLQGGTTKWGDGDPKQKAIDLGFDSIKRGIRTYHCKQEPTLYYKNVTGAPGQPYPDMAFFLPVEMVRDPSSGEYYNSIALRYKASDRENRMIEEWVRDKRSDDYDKFRFNHLSEIGWQQARLRQSVIWSKT